MTILRNSRIEMEFDLEGRLIRLQDVEGRVRIPIDAAPQTAAFEIQLRHSDGTVIAVTPQTPPAITLRRNILRCEWQVRGDWGALTVTGTITLPVDSPASEWRLTVRNATRLAIFQVV